MSNEVFPSLPGLAWNVVRKPMYHTKTQKALSGREIRLAFMSQPMYQFTLTYEVLRQNATYSELKQLGGFFLNRQGSFDSFLFADPTDSTVTAMPFGVGNGSTTAFPLVINQGTTGSNASYQQVQNVANLQVYINGSLTSAYTNSNGTIQFNVPPPNGAGLTWSGTYYYRVRFNQDANEFNAFMQGLWELKKCELYGALTNKV